MINRYRVSLNGQQIDQLDSSIVLLDVRYPQPGFAYSAEIFGQKDGAVITGKRREKASAEITFMVRKYSTAERNAVIQKVISWAKSGGILRINDRPGQALYHAIPDVLPTISVKEWTEDLRLVLSDYVDPYWRDETETEITIESSTDGSGDITINGSADQTVLDATITASGSVTWIKVYTSLGMLYMTDLGMGAGDSLTIDHDDQMNVRIRLGQTSMLAKRTRDSMDDLFVPVGIETIRVQADGAVETVVHGRGCWI